MKVTGGRTALQVENDLADAKQIDNKRKVRRGTAYISTYLNSGDEVKGKLILWPNTEVRMPTLDGYKVTYAAATQTYGGPRMITETFDNGGVCNIVNMSDLFYAVVHFTREKIDD